MMTSANAHGVPAIARHISMRRSWSIVLLLHLTLALSFVCRLQLAFVVVPVKQAFHASDFQIGLLLGPVFGVTYAVFGLLSGWLADFANRRLVIAAAIALWCAMTIACGFASSFPLFALFMMGLAIGEAAITPCALSLIGDLFPASRRAAPVSVYMAASFIGPAIAFFFGTRIVDLAHAIMPQDGLILGREAWQMSFVLIGVTVMLLAPLVLITIREPLRTDDGKPSDPLLIGGASLAGNVKQHALVYFGLCLIAACIFALGFSATWYPTYLSRMWQWTPDRIGAVQGTILLITGVVGAGLSGWIAQHLLARGNAAGPYLALLAGLVVMTPGYIFFPHASTVEWMLALMFVALLGQSICTSAGPAALLQFASPQIRGRAVAAYFMIGSVIGSALGPSLAGWISDHGDPTTGLAMGLAICGSVFGPLGVVLALLIRRRYMAGLTD